MRPILAAFLVYVLFLIQASLTPYCPDLILLALLAFALRETRLVVTLLGFFGGLLADLTAPATAGAGILAYSALAYGAASLQNLLYRARWYVLLLAIIGIVLRHAIPVLAGTGFPGWNQAVVSAALTVALAVPAELLISRLFYRRWTPG
ncbi:MAG: rod shape-determining protein MreD [candidate division WOR-3 bacterium]|nr:MAG: rod shape-determining protein MreD [candidate division WOR-3 bacterium]